jgi:drug/metabolite transporter (DMT)-like permease
MTDAPTTSATPRADRRFGPLAWCLLSALLFGASTPATKQFTATLHPLQIAGLLYAGAGLCVSPWAFAAWRRNRSPRSARQRWYLLGALLFGGVIGPVLLVLGLARAPAGSVALWLNLETVATALFARFFFKEHLSGVTYAAVALIILASLLLSAGDAYAGSAAVLVGLACIAWGLDNNLTSLIDSYTPAQITFAKGLVGALINLGLSLHFSAAALELRAVASVLSVGALGYGLSLVLYVGSAQQLGATRSQLIFSTAPAWGLCLSWLVLAEPVQGVQVLAALLMLAALWLYNRERHGHAHEHAALEHGHWHRHDDGHHEHPHPHPSGGERWHSHDHVHVEQQHAHPHLPDLHHRHRHRH